MLRGKLGQLAQPRKVDSISRTRDAPYSCFSLENPPKRRALKAWSRRFSHVSSLVYASRRMLTSAPRIEPALIRRSSASRVSMQSLPISNTISLQQDLANTILNGADVDTNTLDSSTVSEFAMQCIGIANETSDS